MDDLIRRSDAIEAIEVVDWYHQNRNKDMVSGANSDEHQAWYKADDVYKALEAVPSADRPSVDKEYLTKLIQESVYDGEACARLLDLVDRPQGEWVDEADKYDASFGIHDYRCSNCNSYADEYIGGHEWYTAGKPNFCPHCGARMKGKDDEDNH